MNLVQPGQRWINHARPELGLGMVIATEGRTVTIRFADQNRDHIFALESAPLSRIRFSTGDVVRTDDGARVAIDLVEERNGIFVYSGTDVDGSRTEIVETVIAASQSFNRPAERLLHGQIDEDRWFSLRYRTLDHRFRLYRDPMWGLLGGRNALLRHQLYVAHEVARRHAPRVLLADEVGLGKTIEAGLVAHYQLVTERIRRVLVVVPESLVHQWLVEMLRRFNLAFSVFDAKRCDAMQGALADDEVPLTTDPAGNPFLEEQLVLVSREFLVDDPARLRLCLQGEWDLMIVDEAHHLQCDEQYVSPAYRVVESLARVTPGVLLLTGTPRQLGAAGHFARLRLLDPERYHDPALLEQEQQEFEPVADLIDALRQPAPLGAEHESLLKARGVDVDLDGEDEADRRERMVDRLLDRFGTGRVMFRNTRASMPDFPRRRLVAYPLDGSGFAASGDSLDAALYPEWECIAGQGGEQWARVDPRVAWLEQWLLQRADEKVLVISSTQRVATALAEALKRRSGIRCATFHEGLGLVERDRAAAWFADADDGCQALVCSEIGSEGRNFQFAHHLVLFDLPLSPDLLEQRIGRLDRIGRTGEVSIHVPYLSGTAQEYLFRWFHEGLDAFESVGSVNQLVYEEVREQVLEVLSNGGASIETLLDQSRALRDRFSDEMRAGRDRLLEMHSCRPGLAEQLVEEGRRADQDGALRDWLEHASACYDINIEIHRQNSVLLSPGERMITPIPGLPDEGVAATFDRHTALENEDLAFLSWEHPLINAIGDLVLNTERGNASLCGLRHKALARGQLAIQCVFVIEAPLFAMPHLACYVPPLLIAPIYDEQGERLDGELDHEMVNARWVPLKYKAAQQIIGIKREALRRMIDLAGEDVATRAPSLLHHHGRAGLENLNEELARLRYLAEVNPAVRQDEVEQHRKLVEAVGDSIRQPRVRLDAIRVLIGL